MREEGKAFHGKALTCVQQRSKPPEDNEGKLSRQRENSKGKGSEVGKNNLDLFRKCKDKHQKR